MLTDAKSIWASKGVWGGGIAVLAALAGLLGYAITPEQQAEIEAALAADQAEREEAQGAVAEGEESGRAGL